MSYIDMVHKLNIPNEDKFISLLKRRPADPVLYILKVQDRVGVEAKAYYKILMKKYEEEGNQKLYNYVREMEYILRDDRDRKKDW